MDRFDVLLLLGIVMIAIGGGLIYVPVGLILFGAGLIGLAVIGAKTDATAETTAKH